VAADASGNTWITNYASNSTTKMNSTGTATSYSVGAQNEPSGVAVDASGNVWIANSGSNSLTKLSNDGTTGTNYTGGGLSSPAYLAVDGAGAVWVSNAGGNPMSISEFSNSGTPLSPSTGFRGAGGLGAVAVDGSGNVWVGNYANVSELVGAATPVVTPLAVGVKNNMLGTRP
jgi:streptogramin lyase